MKIYNKIEYQIRDYSIHLNTTFSKYKRKRIKTFWCRANNFGDWLTPVILNYYGFTVQFVGPYESDIIMVGSILEQVPHLYKGVILGTGMIYPESKLLFPHAEILGLRGNLTKINTSINYEIILGDPGLLISILVKKAKKKKYKLGIIPHVNHKLSNVIERFKSKKNVKIIDPQFPPIKVAKAVSSCEAVLSSSLHGLIFADSFGIPNRRIILDGNLVGGNFKFDDYYSVLDCKESPLFGITGDENIDSLIESTTCKNQTITNDIKNKYVNILETFSHRASEC